MTLARWNPISDVVSLREAMDRLFEDSFIRPTAWTGLAAGQLSVPVDLWETKDTYHLRADLPGLRPEDIEINATSDMVTLSGETEAKTEVSDEGWIRQERRTGKFTRSFALPVQIDPNKVEANFNHGVLEMTLPKAENVKPRTIKINATVTK
jgi:HSP20 family protein